jgi:LuxR family transcriptional regulator, maltose regulon positive regulatory protein
VGSAVRSETVDEFAPAVRAGIVIRRQLFARLAEAGRVTLISAPTGSGKTLLLQSWIADAGLAKHVAWVPVQREERDPQRFWISVVDALRDTAAGPKLVQPLTAAPDLDGWAIVERLLTDLAALEDRIWLVVNDVHELGSADVLAQLELLVMRAPGRLRIMLATRRDVRLGLHRLRLEGELTEIRAADLRFTLGEARALLEAAGVVLPDPALALLHARTEGWVAGLRLAALSLAGHPDPERFAAEFCGSERTVAEYLLAEVLERQSEEVRRLMLRTSVLERVNGELADLLTGGWGGEWILQDLEAAGAFVVSLDARRSWFRYHPLFADLLQLQMRCTAPGELPALHIAAAGWFAEHGYPVEAVRHAQAAQDWELAARLLSDQWFCFVLNGQAATAHELLARFPAAVVATCTELSALLAGDELNHGSLEEAARQLARARQGLASVRPERRGRVQILLTILRLCLARQRGDLPAVAEEAQRLLAPAAAPDATQLGLGDDLRALALVNLGMAELWTARSEQAERHLKQGVALARRIGRPYLELTGLTHGASLATFRSCTLGAQSSRQAIALAERHGWTEEPITGVACVHLGGALVAQGQLAEAGPWLDRAERTLRAEIEPAAGMTLQWARGNLERARGRHQEALAAFETAGRLAEMLATPYVDITAMRANRLETLVQLGETAHAESDLAAMEPRERAAGEMRIALAVLRLACDEPRAAVTALAPVTDGSVRVHPIWQVEALLLEATARDALGDAAAAERALERSLDLTGSGVMLLPFLLHPAPRLLERHRQRRTAHAALITEIMARLAGTDTPGPPPGPPPAPPPGPPLPFSPVSEWEATGDGEAPRGRWPHEPLSQSETRVLRYLPTNLTAPEIASQLSVSVHTVRTHMRHVYDKLSAHRRGEAVERARALGLLSPRPGRQGPPAPGDGPPRSPAAAASS